MSGVSRRFWVLLALSAALNLFCLGVFASRFMPSHMRHMHHMHNERAGDGAHGERGTHGERGERAFLRRAGLLDAGPEVSELVLSHRAAVRDNMRAVSEARSRAQAALRAEPFDPERLRTAFEEVRTRTMSTQADMHGVLSQVATKLSPEQRARLADALWRGAGWTRNVRP